MPRRNSARRERVRLHRSECSHVDRDVLQPQQGEVIEGGESRLLFELKSTQTSPCLCRLMSERICNSSWCSNVLPPERKTPRCSECDRHYRQEWLKRQDPEQVKASKRDIAQAYYERNKERYRALKREQRAQLRNEMLDAYGAVCSCCGESERAFLTLEHINRDGKAHRMSLTGTNNSVWSNNVYADLKRREWPRDGYTLHCYNCNNASWKLGVCPHKEK